jgi:hypothetical protein
MVKPNLRHYPSTSETGVEMEVDIYLLPEHFSLTSLFAVHQGTETTAPNSNKLQNLHLINFPYNMLFIPSDILQIWVICKVPKNHFCH